jgi:glycosyltransferase involved in cell wall biosynthesis
LKTGIVVHAPMSDLGGAELVNLHVMKVLSEMDFALTLFSDGWNSLPILSRFGSTVENVNWEYLPPSRFTPRLRFLSSYQRLSYMIARQRMIDKRFLRMKADLIFDTFSGWDLPNTDTAHQVVYFHEIPPLSRPLGRMRGLYYLPAEKLFDVLMRKIERVQAICNSNYTRNLLLRQYGKESSVIHPPVNVRFFEKVGDIEPRENRLVVLARFCEEKRLDVALRLLGEMATAMNDVKVSLVGSVTSTGILAKLQKMSRDLGLDRQVDFLTNVDMERVREELGKSKVILSTMPNEPFGTAIVEGMAAGCVPLVHRSGGQYEDIVDHDLFGVSYEDEMELAEKTRMVLQDNGFRLGIKHNARKRASEFDSERFRKDMVRTIGMRV